MSFNEHDIIDALIGVIPAVASIHHCSILLLKDHSLVPCQRVLYVKHHLSLVAVYLLLGKVLFNCCCGCQHR